MTKTRVIFFLITILFVGIFGYIISLYARGYKFNPSTFKFTPSGLLVAKSSPDGAQIFINGDLKTATNANLSLSPATYDIEIRKEGYTSWKKRLTISKEVVTEVNAELFKKTPSLSPITFTSVVDPVSSSDSTKIAYCVPATLDNINQDREGLWVIETVNLPLGFSRDPRRVTDGDMKDASWIWSPDGRQILLQTSTGNYLLDVGSFTPQNKLINISLTVNDLLDKWSLEDKNRLEAQERSLPKEFMDILDRKTNFILFSPDETKVLYKVSSDAQIPTNLIEPFPGSSTQKEERNLTAGNIYVYDIKEDKNFLVGSGSNEDTSSCKSPTTAAYISCNKTLNWYPTSRHLLLSESGKISVMDYDGTNLQEVYSGSYITLYAFPTVSSDRIIILTDLGASTSPSNLYSVGLK